MSAICKQCRFVHAYAKSDPWYRWMCTQEPKQPDYNHVTGDFMEPWGLCKYRNPDGQCGEFEAGPNVFNPKDATNGNA